MVKIFLLTLTGLILKDERVAEYVTFNPHDFDVNHDKISRSNDTVIIFPDDSVIRSSGFFSRYSRAAEHLLSIRIDQSIGRVQQWVERISEDEAKIIEFHLGELMKQFSFDLNFAHNDSTIVAAEFYKWQNYNYFFSDRFKSL